MLKKKFRLIKRGSFSYVYRNGSRAATQSIKLAFIKSKGLKIGFSVGSKVGGAVTRNLVKRRMRYAASLLIKQIDSGYQMVFICGDGVSRQTYAQIYSAMEYLLKKSKIITTKNA